MTQHDQDLARQWAHHLDRLDPVRRHAVLQALQHSSDTGWPASERAVSVLVAYALGEITSREYAAEILESLGRTVADRTTLDVPAASSTSYVAADVADPYESPRAAAAPPAAPTVQVRREDAVHAYVTGQIPVGEFLRIARG